MLLQAICKIFSDGAVAYGREIIEIYIFFNDASVNAGKICLVHLRERQAQFLVQSTGERRKQQTSADFAGDFNPST